MEKMWRRAAMLLLLAAGIMGGRLLVSAETKTISLRNNEEYNYDLNKDGKKERVECLYRYGGKDRLYINGEEMLSVVSRNLNGYYLMDINEKDSYLDIYVRSKQPGKSLFYRYNGRKMIAIAVGLYGDGKIFKSVPVETHWWSTQPGNGIYIAYIALGGFSARQGYGGYIPMAAKFRQIGKRMAFWADAEHELAMSTSNGLGQTDYSIVPSATGTLVAYNKPAVTGVNKVFTLKKGDKYIYLTVKFSSPYSFIQIKDLKTQKTGWVGVKTSQLKLAAEVGQEEKPVEENTNTQKKKQTITVNKTIVKTYREGEIFSLGARAPGKLTYASNNTNVAVVSKTGLVKITGCGTAVIIVNAAATAEYESATAAVRLTVNSWDEVQFLSLTSEKKGYLMFRWGKNSRMSGYRIEFSSNKAFNPAKKGTADKNVTQGTAQGLISGQVYYARIRGYRVVNDQIIYGPWSAVKSCRVK